MLFIIPLCSIRKVEPLKHVSFMNEINLFPEFRDWSRMLFGILIFIHNIAKQILEYKNYNPNYWIFANKYFNLIIFIGFRLYIYYTLCFFHHLLQSKFFSFCIQNKILAESTNSWNRFFPFESADTLTEWIFEWNNRQIWMA